MHRGCDYTPAANIQVYPQRAAFGQRWNFELEALVECRAAITEHVRVVALRWQSISRAVCLGLPEH